MAKLPPKEPPTQVQLTWGSAFKIAFATLIMFGGLGLVAGCVVALELTT